MPGRVKGGDTGDVACDHYHRLESDLDLMAGLGVKAYRFSVAWPRNLPDGYGEPNTKGLGFYDRLLDGLKARGIKAFATLYHWDLPLTLTGRGGWTDRDTASAFADYARLVTNRLGDRLDTVVTFNEPWCSVYLGHLMGVHAPGERSMEAAMAALHVTNLAHGLGVQAIRAERPDLPVGIVLNAMSVMAASASECRPQGGRTQGQRFPQRGVLWPDVRKGLSGTPFWRNVRIWRHISRTGISRSSGSRSISGV
jgi:beta-glucosidase